MIRTTGHFGGSVAVNLGRPKAMNECLELGNGEGCTNGGLWGSWKGGHFSAVS